MVFMRCETCNSNLRKVDRRNEMADLEDGATDGQMADYLAAELSGDNGAWNLGIVEYYCRGCKSIIALQSDELPSYNDLIIAWHEKANDGDYFSRFVFEYLAFIAHLKNNLYYFLNRDRLVIQQLKRDQRIGAQYLRLIADNPELENAWGRIIEELHIQPLYNSSQDLDHPELDWWWNNIDDNVDHSDELPKGLVHALDDWPNMVEFWYCVRNNLFHGGKHPNIKRDFFLVEHSYKTIRFLVESEVAQLE